MGINWNLEEGKVLACLGLKENPFTTWPDTRFLYLAKPHLSLAEEIVSTFNERRVSIVFGEEGTGKTVLSKRLYQLLGNESQFNVGVIHPSNISSQSNFYLSLLEAYNLKKHRVMKKRVKELASYFLLSEKDKKTNILIIDHAEFLPYNKLDIITDFINSQIYKENGFPIIFFCRPYMVSELRKAIFYEVPNYKELQLSSLSLEETKELIDFRCMVAGRNRLFTLQSVERIFVQAQGNPRKIVLLCQAALRIIAIKKKLFVDIDDIEFVIEIAHTDPKRQPLLSGTGEEG